MIRQSTVDKYLNKRFQNLVVIEVYHKKFQKRNKTYCRCKCVCGNENYHVIATDLAKVSSCGCSKKENGIRNRKEHKLKYVGKSYYSNKYGEFTIIDYVSSKEIYIKFKNTENVECVCMSHINDGELKDSHKPMSYNGYIGRGEYHTHRGFGIIAYNKWRRMLTRCYDEEFINKQPTYKGCSVCDEWLNYQNFAKWLENNWYECDEDLELDKDLLIYKNKQYSPNSCCLIPHKINQAIVHKRFDIDYMTNIYNQYEDIVPPTIKESLHQLTN